MKTLTLTLKSSGAFPKITSVVNVFIYFFLYLFIYLFDFLEYLWMCCDFAVKHLLQYKLNFKGVIRLDRCLMVPAIFLCIL